MVRGAVAARRRRSAIRAEIFGRNAGQVHTIASRARSALDAMRHVVPPAPLTGTSITLQSLTSTIWAHHASPQASVTRLSAVSSPSSAAATSRRNDVAKDVADTLGATFEDGMPVEMKRLALRGAPETLQTRE
eukprot:6983405-Prymnesium_polylepis.2